jgi:Fe-S oxidoreductase
MVDACVYCGLCEQACPADIPLKDLYRFVARVVGQGGILPGVQPAPIGDMQTANEAA